MDIDHLHEFMVLSQTGHYQEAAHKLYISQSTLTKHIQKLEAELEVPLFRRTTRKVELTEYGRTLLPYAQRILDTREEYADALLSCMDEEKKRIVIGAIPALAQYHITDTIVRFKKEHPGFSFQILQAGSEELLEMLHGGRIELAFVRELDLPQDGLARIPYTSDCLAAVLPAAHPLAGGESIDLAALAAEDFILLEQGSMVHGLALQACKASGFTPNVVHTDHKIENIMDLAAQGLGVALLMKGLATHIPLPGVHVADIRPTVCTSINVCYPSAAGLSPVARHFLKCIKSYE